MSLPRDAIESVAEAVANRLLELWALDAGMPPLGSPSRLAAARTRSFTPGGIVAFSNPRPLDGSAEFLVTRDQLAKLGHFPIWDAQTDGLRSSDGEFIPAHEFGIFRPGQIVSRDGTDEHLVLAVTDDLIHVECIQAPAPYRDDPEQKPWCAVDDREWNLPRRYRWVRDVR